MFSLLLGRGFRAEKGGSGSDLANLSAYAYAICFSELA